MTEIVIEPEEIDPDTMPAEHLRPALKACIEIIEAKQTAIRLLEDENRILRSGRDM